MEELSSIPFNIWERRTAIVSTTGFIKQGDLDETFCIAEILYIIGCKVHLSGE